MSKQQISLLRHTVIRIHLCILYMDNPNHTWLSGKMKPLFHTCHHHPSSPLCFSSPLRKWKYNHASLSSPPFVSQKASMTLQKSCTFSFQMCVCVCCTSSFGILKESETCLCRTFMREGKKLGWGMQKWPCSENATLNYLS